MGLREVTGLGEAAAKALTEARRSRAFADFDDLVRRSALTPAQLQKLAEADAFCSLGLGRRSIKVLLFRARRKLRDLLKSRGLIARA